LIGGGLGLSMFLDKLAFIVKRADFKFTNIYCLGLRLLKYHFRKHSIL
jgi:hypothetical protein